MIYYFQALDQNGRPVNDFIDAVSESAARQKIRGKGLYPVKIEHHEVGDKKTETSKSKSITFLQKLADKISTRFMTRQVGLFSRQLATLLNAGMSLIVSINNTIEQIDNLHFKNIVTDIKEKIEEGTTFSNALSRHRDVFSDMYINMVRVGENLGSLEQVMERLADMEEKRSILRNKIQAALYYPLFMFIFAVIVVIFLMINVIPSIAQMFIEQNRALPLPTKIVIFASDFLANFWLLIPALLVFGYYIFKRTISTPEGRKKIDELKLRLPVIKNLYKKILVYRFTQNLGVLIDNNVDVIKSMEIVSKVVNNTIIEEKIMIASKNIREGASISTSLQRADFLPSMVRGMISAGEASDKLDSMLINIGTVYENEIEMTINSLTSLLEPVIIIFMGLVIGTIVMSVMLPLMEMNILVQ